MKNAFDEMIKEATSLPWAMGARLMVELRSTVNVPQEPVMTKSAALGLIKMARIGKYAQNPEEAQMMAQEAAMTDPNVVAALDHQQAANEREALMGKIQELQMANEAAQAQVEMSNQAAQAATQQAEQTQAMLEQSHTDRTMAVQESMAAKDQVLQSQVMGQQHRHQLAQAAEQMAEQLKQMAATSPEDQQAQQQEAMAAQQEQMMAEQQAGAPPGSKKTQKAIEEANTAQQHAQVQGAQADEAQMQEQAQQEQMAAMGGPPLGGPPPGGPPPAPGGMPPKMGSVRARIRIPLSSEGTARRRRARNKAAKEKIAHVKAQLLEKRAADSLSEIDDEAPRSFTYAVPGGLAGLGAGVALGKHKKRLAIGGALAGSAVGAARDIIDSEKRRKKDKEKRGSLSQISPERAQLIAKKAQQLGKDNRGAVASPQRFQKQAVAGLGTLGAYAGIGAAVGAGKEAARFKKHEQIHGRDKPTDKEIRLATDYGLARREAKENPSYKNKLRLANIEYKLKTERMGREHPDSAVKRGAIRGAGAGLMLGPIVHRVGLKAVGR